MCKFNLETRWAESQLTPWYDRTAIVPIGVLFSFSLIFGNVAYMYLSVSFIQMLKVASAAPAGSFCS